MGKATWGSVLSLLENEAIAAYGRPQRFGTATSGPPLAQFPEWPAIYQAAVALNLYQLGRPIAETVAVITRLLCAHYLVGQVLQLPLSEVVPTLQRILQQPGQAGEGAALRVPASAAVAGAGPSGPARVGGAGVPGMTAEERVRGFLADNGRASIEQARNATGLSRQAIRRTQAWKDHDEELLDTFLKKHPDAHISDVTSALGYCKGKICGMRSWREHEARREAAKPPPRVKERPLTQQVLGCRSDAGSAAPDARAEQRDEILRTIRQTADPDTRARLRRLTGADQEVLVGHLLSHMDDAATERPDVQRSRAIMLAVAATWLEEREQERRHQQRHER
jgi:hypothetical protein